MSGWDMAHTWSGGGGRRLSHLFGKAVITLQ